MAVEPLDDLQQANLREIRRDWLMSNALPESLVQRQTIASARCEHAWRTQRPANDWDGFLGNFREVLALAREEATLLSVANGPASVSARIDYVGDVDVFRVIVPAKGVLVARATGGMDTVGLLLTREGAGIEHNDDAQTSGLDFGLTYDSRDTPFNATRGIAAAVEYLQSDESLGADRDWERAELMFAAWQQRK